MATVYTNETGALVPAVGACPTHKHGVCWSSVIAGSIAAIAVTFALMVLEASFGLAISSPWSGQGVSGVALTANMIIAMIVVQWLSSALGGYLAGRLRSRWVNTHTDEVFFRDTAHGFLVWCVATLVTVLLLGSAVAAVTKNSHVDEVTVVQSGDVIQSNVKAHNDHGVVSTTTTMTKEEADKARKAAATTALFTFLSMLIGAFIASASAVVGGHCRDDVKKYVHEA